MSCHTCMAYSKIDLTLLLKTFNLRVIQESDDSERAKDLLHNKTISLNLFLCQKERSKRPIDTMHTVSVAQVHVLQPHSQGSLLPTLRSERERDPGKRWSRGSRTKLFLREESFVSHFLSGLFTTFTQGSQQQDRFANPTTMKLKEISA